MDRMPRPPRHRPARPLLLAAGLLLLTGGLWGCEALENTPNAIGREGEITIVIDSTRWKGEVGEAIREELGMWIGTLPAPERMFDLVHLSLVSPRVLDVVKKQKNVVFVAPLSDSTNEAKFIASRLDEGAKAAILAGQSAVIPRRDLWRRYQQVVYVTAATPEAVAEAVHERGEDLRYVFNTITRERMTISMFEKGRQKDLEQQIMDRHDFAVNVQHDYFIALDTTNFIWLRRVVSNDSWRSLFVYYEEHADPSELTPEWVYATRDSLTRQYVRGTLDGFVAIDYRRPLETENINFLDRFAYETRGLWHMLGVDENGETYEYGMGGPFLTYAFYDQDTGRTYLIDGMVFAPGYDKREFLRQLEVIAYTFRTRQEEEAQAEPVPAD